MKTIETPNVGKAEDRTIDIFVQFEYTTNVRKVRISLFKRGDKIWR